MRFHPAPAAVLLTAVVALTGCTDPGESDDDEGTPVPAASGESTANPAFAGLIDLESALKTDWTKQQHDGKPPEPALIGTAQGSVGFGFATNQKNFPDGSKALVYVACSKDSKMTVSVPNTEAHFDCRAGHATSKTMPIDKGDIDPTNDDLSFDVKAPENVHLALLVAPVHK